MKKIILLILLLIALCSFVYAVVDLNDGIYSYYDFETDPATNNLVDVVGDNDSTADTVVGRVNSINGFGWNFSIGADQRITMPTDLINGKPTLTISCWSYLYPWSRTQGASALWESLSTSQNSPVWGLGTILYYRWKTTGSSVNQASPEDIAFIDKWSNVVMTYDGERGVGWFDGNLETNNSITGTVMANDFYIGFYDVGGIIDECAFWNRALNPDEIALLWNGGSGTFYPFTAPVTIADTIVNNNSVNFTSDGGQICGYDGATYTDCGPTLDTTPTFKFRMNGTSDNVVITNATGGVNYTTAINGTYNYTVCSNTVGTEWTCTVDFDLIIGNKVSLYIAAQAGTFETNSFDNANTFDIIINTTQILLNGVEGPRIYEYQTTVDISGLDFITVYDNTSRYINQTSPFNYVIDTLRLSDQKDASIGSGSAYNISIDNRTELVSLNASMLGVGIGNLTLNYSDNYLNFPGLLSNGELFQNAFIFEDVEYRTANLSFRSAETKQIKINYSSQGKSNRNGLFNFTITAFAQDINNELTYTETMNNFTFNYENSTKLGTHSSVGDLDGQYNSFENFANDATFPNWVTEKGLYRIGQSLNCRGPDNCIYESRTHPQAGRNSMYSTQIDYSALTYFNIEMFGVCRCGCTNALQFYDLTDSVEILSQTSDTCWIQAEPAENTYNVTFNKTDANTWQVNYITTGENVVKSVSVSSLTKPYYLRLINSRGSNSQAAFVSIIGIGAINLGGIYINKTDTRVNGINGGNTNLIGNFTTHSLNITSDNIDYATLTIQGDFPDDTNTTLYLSNDGAQTFEQTVNGSPHLFTSVGKNLSARFELKSANNLSTPLITNYVVQIIPSSLKGLSIDIGSDNIIEKVYDFELNDTTTPLYWGLDDSDINDYIFNTCGTDSEVCEIPISFISDSGGIVQISDLNLTEDINEVRFNVSSLEKQDTINISAEYSSANLLNFTSVKLDYRGSKNITIKGAKEDGTNVVYAEIEAVYSPFNISIPSNQSYWQLFPSKRTQNDIEPYGQTDAVPFWNIKSSEYHDKGVDIYVRYNESIDSCVENNTFENVNSAKVTCYQENATAATACGGLSTGSYTAKGNWQDPSLIYDDDYTTSTNGVGGSTLEINYTIPATALSAVWQVKDGTGFANYSLSQSCFYGDTLILQVDAAGACGMLWSCRNTSDELYQVRCVGSTVAYEEAIFWELNQPAPNPSTNITINITGQKIVNNISTSLQEAKIWTYTDIDCSSTTDTLIIPLFCYYSLCSNCVITQDAEDTCDAFE